MPTPYTVTFGAQMGDPRCSAVMTPPWMALKQILRERCEGPYCEEVNEFALVLRVDGDISYWEQEGCDRMRRSRTEHYITIDIYVPKSRWQNQSDWAIRCYLMDCVDEAFRQMVGKLERDKVVVAGEALRQDLGAVRSEYLQRRESLCA